MTNPGQGTSVLQVSVWELKQVLVGTLLWVLENLVSCTTKYIQAEEQCRDSPLQALSGALCSGPRRLQPSA